MQQNNALEMIASQGDNCFLKLWGCITIGSLTNKYITANTNILTFNL